MLHHHAWRLDARMGTAAIKPQRTHPLAAGLGVSTIKFYPWDATHDSAWRTRWCMRGV